MASNNSLIETNELNVINNITPNNVIEKFILDNNIVQVHNSKGTCTGPKNYPKYKNRRVNTLFWGMYRIEDIKLCIGHYGKKWVYWHYNDCNPKYEERKYNLKKINKLENLIHLCDNFETYRFLERQNIKFLYLGTEIIYNQFIDLKLFNSFLKNKKIIIVGPAPYLENYELGNFIDSFDIVVRINKGHQMTKDSKKFGSRTDILFHCVSQKFENGGELNNDLIKNNNIKCIFFCYPKLTRYENTSFRFGGNTEIYEEILDKNLNVNKAIIDKTEYKYMEKNMGTRPNSGIIAIDQISKYTNNLYVVGFTFFKGGYNKLYRSTIDGYTNNLEKVVLNRIKGTHDVNKQIKYFNDKILKKIYIDSYFKELFANKFTNFRDEYYCLEKNKLVNNI